MHFFLRVKRSDRVVSLENILGVIQAFISHILAHDDQAKVEKLRLKGLILEHIKRKPYRQGTLPSQKVSGVCCKGFRKPFREYTSVDTNGCVLLKSNGTAELLSNRRTAVTKGYVLPNNLCRLMRFRTHIYVAHCASMPAIKHIDKYVFKGCDCEITEMMRKKMTRVAGGDMNFDAGLPTVLYEEGVEGVRRARCR